MSKALFFKQNRLALASVSIALLLVACGGGSSSSDTPENQAETPTTSEPSNSATESHYKEIAGTWEATLDKGYPEEETFKFTIDLNGVGRWKGDLLYVTKYVSRKEIVIKPRCKTGPTDCIDDKIVTAYLKSNNTKMKNGIYGGYGEASTFEATKIKGI